MDLGIRWEYKNVNTPYSSGVFTFFFCDILLVRGGSWLMHQHQYTKEDDQYILENYPTLGAGAVAQYFTEKYGTLFNRKQINNKAARLRTANRGYELPELPSEKLEAQELLDRQEKQFARKHAAKEARKLIDIKVKLSGAIGILHFGDPHLDDNGTDIGLVRKHVALINETEGLFAGNIGDTTNNWVGKLARLYGEQTATAQDAWTLAEWFFTACPWLYIIDGNHNAWSGAGDPLKWIAAQNGQPYESNGVRLALNFPNGRQVRINARHNWQGHSMWNASHAQGRAIQMGMRDHIVISGHVHKSGMGIYKDPLTGLVSHGIQVATYKKYDKYADEKGYPDQNISPAVLTIIDPRYEDDDPGLVNVFHSVEEGVKFLKFKRLHNW